MMKLCMTLGTILLATAALADEPAKPATDAASAPGARAKPGKKGKFTVVVSASELKWNAPPDAHGVQIATIRGNMTKGAYRVMVKFPPGTSHPVHTHSGDVEVVVISGTFLYGADDASAKDLGPGSYAFIPGGTKHISGCKAGAECLVFQSGTEKFDMTPVGEPKPAEAAPTPPPEPAK
jgi:quercetin dioxygenase-like cupin family protein